MVKSHYQTLLGEHYTWTFGNINQKYEMNRNLLGRFIKSGTGKTAMDLGCGSGFQTIPLLQKGCRVIAIDSSLHLLSELQQEAKSLNCDPSKLETIEGDMLTFPEYLKEKVDIAVCMGDTITHLASLEEVKILLAHVFESLYEGGLFLVQFRDLTHPLQDTDRFIPVKSDERTVFTCFLEWVGAPTEEDGSGCIIKVHDLVHVKKGIGAWELCSSYYNKLGLTKNCVIKLASESGLKLLDSHFDNMEFLCFNKP
jgi:SAM-dependent methyltransferase